MTIHYELDDEHIVRITIDRPEARNSADLDHFKWLREAWERFDADADAWVAIITGVGDAFFTGADLKTYVPAITALGKRIQASASASNRSHASRSHLKWSRSAELRASGRSIVIRSMCSSSSS